MGKRVARIWLLGALAMSSAAAGCAAAVVGAGAGAAGVAYFTTRGAKSTVNGSIDQVAAISQTAMAEKDIPVNSSSSEKSGAHREIKGTKGDLDVTVILDQNSAKLTDVEVTARKNLVEWDKDYAKSLLDRIVASTQ